MTTGQLMRRWAIGGVTILAGLALAAALAGCATTGTGDRPGDGGSSSGAYTGRTAGGSSGSCH